MFPAPVLVQTLEVPVRPVRQTNPVICTLTFFLTSPLLHPIHLSGPTYDRGPSLHLGGPDPVFKEISLLDNFPG